ncbi:MAG: PucR family transcriptional regulator [Pseudonocardiaceae bacterium]
MSATTGTNRKELAAALVEALGLATDVIRGRARHHVRQDTQVIGQVPDDAIDAAFELQYERILDAIRGAAPSAVGRSDADRLPADPPRVERQFALFRECPDLMQSVCGATFKETVDCIREVGEQISGDLDAVLEIISVVSEVSDTALLALGAAGHGSIELAEIGWDAELCIDVARTLLLGGKTTADLRSQATVFGIDTERDYVAFRARPCSGHGFNELAQELGMDDFHQFIDGLVVIVEGDLVGFLASPPAQVQRGLVGIGPPTRADDLADSFELATRAFDTAYAFGLSGVHPFEGLGLLPAIFADTDVGESVQRRYLQPMVDMESLPELLGAIRTYFACGMHVDRAAKQMFLHPNTLRNRISKFEELTGANLRDPTVAIEVWWALQRVSLDPARTPYSRAC